jgi:hypothetical protein
MDEEQWVSCTDPIPILEFLRGRASDRKLRLFAVACCRRVWHLFEDGRTRGAVEMAERYADGLASAEGLAGTAVGAAAARCAYEAASRASLHEAHADPDSEQVVETSWAVLALDAVAKAAYGVAYPVAPVAAEAAAYGGAYAVAFAAGRQGPDAAEGAAQAAFLRDLFGPLPFCTPALNPAWLTWNAGTVRRLAEAAYQERSVPAGTLDNDRLAVLADALEEAGCGDAGLLEHLRGPGPHVRGCWAVDLLLGHG